MYVTEVQWNEQDVGRGKSAVTGSGRGTEETERARMTPEKPLTLYLYEGRFRPGDNRHPLLTNRRKANAALPRWRTNENGGESQRLFPLPVFFLRFFAHELWRDQRTRCSLVGQIMKTSTTETRTVNLGTWHIMLRRGTFCA